MTVNRTSIVSQETELAAALPVQVPDLAFVVDGVKTTTVEFGKVLAGHIAEAAAIAEERAQLHLRILAHKAMRKQIVASIIGLKATVQGTYGVGSPQWIGLKFPVRQRKPPSVDTKQAAAAKAKLTRKARGTLGKKQKAAIHGAPPAPSPSPAPAPAVVTPNTAGH
jgi:hypothetical protein